MDYFIALLRGINVGKAKRVPMEELRNLLHGLGYMGVATWLNSGNAVFCSKEGRPSEHAEAIAAALSANLKIEVPVIVKSAREWAQIISENPIAETVPDFSRLLVVLTQNSGALQTLEAIKSLIIPPEQFVVGKHAAYLHCANGILESKAGKAILGKMGARVTTRNWATVLKLKELASGTCA